MAIQIEYCALYRLDEWEGNPKDHDLEGIRKSIDRFGFIEPAVYDETTERIVAGHGRKRVLEQMRDANEQPPSNVHVEDDVWFMPVVRGLSFESEDEARAYLLASNRYVENGGWNRELLAEYLERVHDETSIDGTGFSDEDLEEIATLDIYDDEGENDDPPEDFVEYDINVDTQYCCPKCGYEWSGQPN